MNPGSDASVLPLESLPPPRNAAAAAGGGGFDSTGTGVPFVDGSWVSSRGLG